MSENDLEIVYDNFVEVEKPMNLFYMGNWGVPKFNLFYRKQGETGRVYFSVIRNLEEFQAVNNDSMKWYIEKEFEDFYKEKLEIFLEGCKNILEYNK